MRGDGKAALRLRHPDLRQDSVAVDLVGEGLPRLVHRGQRRSQPVVRICHRRGKKPSLVSVGRRRRSNLLGAVPVDRHEGGHTRLVQGNVAHAGKECRIPLAVFPGFERLPCVDLVIRRLLCKLHDHMCAARHGRLLPEP